MFYKNSDNDRFLVRRDHSMHSQSCVRDILIHDRWPISAIHVMAFFCVSSALSGRCKAHAGTKRADLWYRSCYSWAQMLQFESWTSTITSSFDNSGLPMILKFHKVPLSAMRQDSWSLNHNLLAQIGGRIAIGRPSDWPHLPSRQSSPQESLLKLSLTQTLQTHCGVTNFLHLRSDAQNLLSLYLYAYLKCASCFISVAVVGKIEM